MKYRLILRGDFINKICKYFFPAPDFSHESYGVIFLSPAFGRKFKTLISAEMWLPKDQDYASRSNASLHMNDAYIAKVYEYCSKNGYSLMTIHSHPFTKSSKNFFSSIDNEGDKANFWFFSQLMPDGFFVSSIMNGNGILTSRLFECSSKDKTPHNFDEILYVDFPLKKEFPNLSNQDIINIDERLYDRQIRVFGKEGQELISKIRVCIVGVGGLGSIIVEILARLGVREFILIDHDIAEWTNLNRFTGMIRRDADKKRLKVKIGRRLIKQINPDARVICIPEEVYSEKSVKAMKDADIIFLGTDNMTSRDFVNTFSVQYLIPVINMGSVINYSKIKKKIISILGDIICSLPGNSKEKFCLRCSGAINTDFLKLENAPGNLRERLGGYILNDNEPAPAVRYVNGLVCDLASVEFHNLVCNFKEPIFYQKINLMPQIFIDDYFFREDFEDFIQYMFEKGIIKNTDVELKSILLNEFTCIDENTKNTIIKKDLDKKIFQKVISIFIEKDFISEEMKDIFLKEIKQYFSVKIEKECELIEIIDVHKDEDNCPICGAKAYIIGQGDLIPLEKFKY